MTTYPSLTIRVSNVQTRYQMVQNPHDYITVLKPAIIQVTYSVSLLKSHTMLPRHYSPALDRVVEDGSTLRFGNIMRCVGVPRALTTLVKLLYRRFSIMDIHPPIIQFQKLNNAILFRQSIIRPPTTSACPYKTI